MARANGKLILVGEHAVVHGHPAVACALDRGVDAWATVAESDRLVLDPWRVRIEPDADSTDPLCRAFAEALAQRRSERPAIEVRCTIALPGGSGLGCSAALGSAVLGAIDEILLARPSPAEHDARVHDWERIFHGNPSGIDRAAASSGGLIRFRTGEPIRPIKAKNGLWMVVVNSGMPSSTKTTVAELAARRERDPGATDACLDRIGELSEHAARAIEDGATERLGAILDENHARLVELGLSTERLDALCRLARERGALGSKLTGGGGGGCAIALAADDGSAQALVRAFCEQGAEAFACNVGGAS